MGRRWASKRVRPGNLRCQRPTNALWRIIGALATVAVAIVIGGSASASPNGAVTYKETLNPILSQYQVMGSVTLIPTTNGLWDGSAHATGLVPGDSYTYLVGVVESYVDGQGVAFHSFVICSLTSTSAGRGSCHGRNIPIEGRSVLTPQSSGSLVLRAPDDGGTFAVAGGEFDYLATLSPYSGLSNGGNATLSYDAASDTWSGKVRVTGLFPATTYTWAADVIEAYDASGTPVSIHRVVLCSFTTRLHLTGLKSGSCSANGVGIESRSDMPFGSYTDVASTHTSVATGTLS